MEAPKRKVVRKFTALDFKRIRSKADLLKRAEEKGINLSKHDTFLDYEKELKRLQACLVNFQQWVVNNKLRVAILFEGRDAAGKGGTIKRFKEHLNPRSARVVALAKPTEIEKQQWFFRRYIKELPNPGEIVFF